MASKKKSKKKKSEKKTPPVKKKPRAKPARFAIGDVEIQKRAIDPSMLVRGPGASKYRSLTDQVPDLAVGEMLQVPIPDEADADKFRLALAGAVKRHVPEGDRQGRIRCCLLRAEEDASPVAVGVMCVA